MRTRFWLAAAVLVLAAGCGSKSKEINRIVESPIEYHSHLSPWADMSRYHTWDWLSPIDDDASLDKQDIEEGIRSEVESAVAVRMKDRGFTRDVMSPDVVVNYHVAGMDVDRDYMRQQYDGKYDPKYRKNFDGRGPSKDSWQEGSIIIFIFDAESGDIVWRSSARAEVTSEAPLEKRVERLDKAIKMMFSSLPGR